MLTTPTPKIKAWQQRCDWRTWKRRRLRFVLLKRRWSVRSEHRRYELSWPEDEMPTTIIFRSGKRHGYVMRMTVQQQIERIKQMGWRGGAP